MATPDHHARQGHRAAQRHARRDGRPADADPGAVRAAGAGRDRRRLARHPRDVAGRAWSAASSSRSRSTRRRTSSRCRWPTSSRRWCRRPRSSRWCGSGARARPTPSPPVGGRRRRRRADAGVRNEPRSQRSRLPGRRRQGLRAVRDHHRGLRRLPDPGRSRACSTRRRSRSTGPACTSSSADGKPVSLTEVHAEPAHHAGHPDARRGRADDGRAASCRCRARCKAYGTTLHQLRWAIVTVMAVLALAFVMNLSGQTITLGTWMAGGGRRVRAAVADPRLARHRGHRLRHLGQLAVRRAAGDRGEPGRAVRRADGRVEQLRRRARQDDLAAEPRDRRRRGRHGRQGGRHLPSRRRVESGVPRRCCACCPRCRPRRCCRGWCRDADATRSIDA